MPPNPLRKGFDHIGICVVFCCHDGNGRFLMHKRSQQVRDEKGCWDFGGGGLKFGETVEQALRREVKEEYGVEILEHEFLGYKDVHRVHEGEPTHWLALQFKVRVDPTLVQNNEPRSIETLGWFTLDSLPAPLHSSIPSELEKHREKLIGDPSSKIGYG